MKPLPFLVLALLFARDEQPVNNPHYDMPDAIIQKDGGREDSANVRMDDLTISGYYKESMYYEDLFMPRIHVVETDLRNNNIVDAHPFILKEARHYRIILFNESHARPQHRLFTKSFLKELHQQGFNTFFVEGLDAAGITTNEKKYPVRTDGWLINEPAYGSLLRYAVNNGYQLVNYEYPTKPWDDSVKLDKNGSMKYIQFEPRDSAVVKRDSTGEIIMQINTGIREQWMADKIYEFIKQHPHSKFVVHAGHGHINEGDAMMCARLKFLLKGEDVLTIEQAELNEKVPVVDSLTHDTLKINYPYLLVDKATHKAYNSFGINHPVDYTIFNPVYKDSLSRPIFLFRDIEQRKPSYPTLTADDGPCLVTAYFSNEYNAEKGNAIAEDIIYTKGINEVPPLLLKSGKYTIVKKNSRGILSSSEITIE
jgi:hypothetical protein